LTMTNDARLAENFGTLSFEIDDSNTTGVYTFNDVGASSDFAEISDEAFISLLDPVNESISWNPLVIYRDPGEFFSIWGINNDDSIIAGFPSEMLFYGNEMTFRTIPNDTYLVKIYGYKKLNNYNSEGDPEIQFDYWLRYLAYGAAVNYASDFRFEAEALGRIQATFARERRAMMFNTHQKVKQSRCLPRF